jgi:hypothetical protein
VDCFENELYPFMKYQLANHITDDESMAFDNCLRHNHSGTLVATATTEEEFENHVQEFFDKYKIDGTSETSLKDELKDLYTQKNGKFDFDDFDNVCRNVWNEYAEKYDPQGDGELSPAARSNDFGVYGLLKDLRAKLNVPGNGTSENFNPATVQDAPGDYLYFPEMTNNGMFISNAKRNNLFYSGPDFIKIFNEIGCSPKCKDSDIGLVHSKMQHMVHRIYGSEMNLRLNKDVQCLDRGYYSPPTRRRLYDESLARLGPVGSKFEIAGYVVLTWQDTMVSQAQYLNF